MAYYFGRELHKQLDVPIGLIHSAEGGTPAESWISAAGLSRHPELSVCYGEILDLRELEDLKIQHRSPTGYFNGMIAPLIPYTLKGVIWYQGEANTRWQQRLDLYPVLFPTLIEDWRRHWGTELPFYYVQTAPFNYGKDYNAAILRDIQRRCLSVPATGMAVTLDIGNPKDIHPAHKDVVGQRLARWALAQTYGKTGIVYSGPLYRRHESRDGKLILHFDHAEEGMVLRENAEQNEFEIAGSDGKYFPATVQIRGEQLVLNHPEVFQPVHARYAWRNAPEATQFNTAGLPGVLLQHW